LLAGVLVFVYFCFFTIVLLLIAAWLLRGAWGRRAWSNKLDAARAALPRQWEELELLFLESASATGKPRGLVWTKSRFDDRALLARDRANGELYALVGITVAFEAVIGGGMEEVAAVSNLRCATALLEWQGRQWSTAGRVLFNMEPREAVDRYAKHLEPIGELEVGGGQ
jgi:hypothetical protein